jgi:hypothetical protein
MGFVRWMLAQCDDHWVRLLLGAFCVVQLVAAVCTAIVTRLTDSDIVNGLTDIDSWATFILTMCLGQYLFIAITANGDITRSFMQYMMTEQTYRVYEANAPHLNRLVGIMKKSRVSQDAIMEDMHAAEAHFAALGPCDSLRESFRQVCMHRNFGVTNQLHVLFVTLIPLMFGVIVPFIGAHTDGWKTLLTNGTILFIVLFTYITTIRMSDPLLYSGHLYKNHKNQVPPLSAKTL